MHIETRALGCRRCDAQITEWLRPWPVTEEGWSHRSEVPVGTWASRPSRQRQGFPVAVHLASTAGHVRHPELNRSIGCCGISYREGQPNLVCAACGAEVGYRLSDGDHCIHGVYLADHTVDTQLVDLPALPESPTVGVVRARGFDALHERFALSDDVAWESDADYALGQRQEAAVELAVVDDVVEMVIDGVRVRPPWPHSEQVRARMLGAIAEGSPEEPVEWWFVPEGTPHTEERAERHDWLHWRDGAWMGLAWSHGQRHAGVKVRHTDWRAALGALGRRAVV